jgi:tetratricopeptide (TPR) repeat protein
VSCAFAKANTSPPLHYQKTDIMKHLVVLLAILISSTAMAQSKYEQGMTKAFELMEQDKMDEASNLFQRIATAEKENWLPYYYVAQVEILKVWQNWEERDETMLKAQTAKAQEYIYTANSFTIDNVYTMYLQAQVHTIWVADDGMKYGMSLSPKVVQLYEKALKLEPNNPMLILSKAEWDMGGAAFFGTSTEPYCKEIERAMTLFPTFKPATQFHPNFGADRVQEVLEKCRA